LRRATKNTTPKRRYDDISVTLRNLTYKMRTRTSNGNERRYSCTFCATSFTRNEERTKRAKVTSGEKQYPCDTCTEWFADNSSLTRHSRTHTGQELYSCDVCEKWFGRKYKLEAHLRTHDGNKPYSRVVGEGSLARNTNLTTRTGTSRRRRVPLHTVAVEARKKTRYCGEK